MNFKSFWFQLLLFHGICTSLTAQEKFNLSGSVLEASSNENLFGVNIIVKELNIGTTTNEYGFFSIAIPEGTYTLQVSYIGFKTIQETVVMNQNIRRNFALVVSNQMLDEVILTDRVNKIEIRKPEMSVNKLTSKDIKELPVVLGEADILRAILTLPGVTNAGEGQSGFNVRGGGADQNLVLLDEAILFNSSHLFGFFSVFNPDAVKDLKLYKGGIPARFGGRLSSVLDIYQKEGNSKKFEMNGGIGLISSRLLAEGPLKKDKGSFLVAGRSSYAHLFLKLADNENSAYFYDLNTKLSYKLNENNNVYLSGYFGRDVFSISESFINTYGNSVFNLRWNHLINDKLFSNLSMIYSDYYYGLEIDFVGFIWDSGIKNYNLKYDFKHYLNEKTKLTYGFNGIYHEFNPGQIRPNNASSSINPETLDAKFAFEPAVYFDVEKQISERFTFNAGLRYSQFYRLGQQNMNVYENDQAVVFNSVFQIYEKATPIGTISYDRNESIANFDNFEPRLAMSYVLNDQTSIKASFQRMAQYLHLISNTQSPTPLDVWTPSDNFLKPQTSDQYAVGYYKNFSEDVFSFEVETFYKRINNRIDYIDGADLIANRAIEQVVLNGRARAYGMEVLFRKNSGKFNGWIAYTLSRSEQQTSGRTPEETGINNGNWYKTGFDKLHDLSIVANYKLSSKWRFGATFALQTGQPVTFPNGQYEFMGIRVPSYGARNEDNLPAYHHLDVSATLTPDRNDGRNWQGEWVFSIYNLYNRRNAASIAFRQNETTGLNEAVRLSIFGIIPSVTYNFKF
jgi:hypothetical protein